MLGRIENPEMMSSIGCGDLIINWDDGCRRHQVHRLEKSDGLCVSMDSRRASAEPSNGECYARWEASDAIEWRMPCNDAHRGEADGAE